MASTEAWSGMLDEAVRTSGALSCERQLPMYGTRPLYGRADPGAPGLRSG